MYTQNMVAQKQAGQTEPDEEAEIAAARKDARSFEPLYNRYFNQVVRFVYKRVEGKDDAFDLTQQVFEKALQNIHQYTFRGKPFLAWLFTIALNEINKSYRNSGIVRVIDFNDGLLQNFSEELYMGAADDHLLFEALKQLTEDDFQLVELRFFEQRPFKEIGDILNITENNAKVQTYRVIDKLKKIMIPS